MFEQVTVVKLQRHFFFGLAIWLAFSAVASAAPLNQAEITRIFNTVDVVTGSGAAKPAQVNEVIRGNQALRTGVQSRAELLFGDQTLTRLGANTYFTFTSGTRDMELNSGTMLLQVPKNSGGAQIRTASVTAAITGTTVLVETNPNMPGAYAKYVVIEGTMRLFLRGRAGESMLVQPGQMVILPPDATRLPNPVNIDLKNLIRSSRLMKGFEKSKNEPQIAEAVEEQEERKRSGELVDTNVLLLGKGTRALFANEELLALLDVRYGQATERGEESSRIVPFPTPLPSPQRSPTPSKGGLPTTITDPNPYIITAGTTIITDPFIITNGITNRGTVVNPGDFAPTALFDSPNPDDGALGFSSLNIFGNPYAAFKFTALEIQGTPRVVTEGGPVQLVLLGINSVSVTGPLNLENTGLSQVGLFTQNGPLTIASTGSVTLGSTQTLSLYARSSAPAVSNSTGANLAINGSIAGAAGSTLNLLAGNLIAINAPVTAGNINASAQDGISVNGLLSANDTLTLKSNTFVSLGHPIFAQTLNLNVGTSLFQTSGSVMSANTINATLAGNLFLNDFLFDTGKTQIINVTANGAFAGAGVDFSGSQIQQYNLTLGTGGLNVGTNTIGSSSTPFNNITVNGGSVTAFQMFVRSLTVVNGNVNVDVLRAGQISVTGDITSQFIRPLNSGATGPYNITANNIEATGDVSNPAFDFDSTAGLAAPTVNVTAQSIVIGNTTGAINNASARSGDNPTGLAGGGGTLVFSAIRAGGSGNINVDNGALIDVSPGSANAQSGAGGTVRLTANNNIQVDGQILVSRNEVSSFPQAQSSRGGAIDIKSLSTGSITISNTAQLESLLDAAAPVSSGGRITVRATAGTITIASNTVNADRGTIEVSADTHNGSVLAPSIDIVNGAALAANIVKIGALGTDGVLRIQAGAQLTGQQQVTLYGGAGGGGTIFFDGTGNVTVTSPDVVMRAHTITVANTAAVNVVGVSAADQLRLFANTRNWGGSNGPIRLNGAPIQNTIGSGTVTQGSFQVGDYNDGAGFPFNR